MPREDTHLRLRSILAGKTDEELKNFSGQWSDETRAKFSKSRVCILLIYFT